MFDESLPDRRPARQPDVQRTSAPLVLGPSVMDSEIDGLDIESAARSLGVAEDDVWRRIRNGQLIARTSRGKVYVYTDESNSLASETVEPSVLPPPPTDDDEPDVFLSRVSDVDNYQPPSHALVASNHEVSALLEHLNLAKEENREILRFSTESMQRMSELSDAMLKMKEDVIQAREEQLELLSQQLKEREGKLRQLTREKENLETVAKFIDQV